MESLISKNYKYTTGKDVWQENLHLAIYAADKIRSTLGPKGAYKLVAYNRGPEQIMKVTKDAIVVLDELSIQYPSAVIIAEAAKMQREEAGDGTATFVILLSSLLKKADELLSQKIHPNIIIHGYFLAANKALEIMEKQAVAMNNSERDILDIVDCGRNVLTPKIRSMIREAYQLAFSDSVFDKEKIRFFKESGGHINDLSLIKGVVLKKEKAHPNMPDRLKGLRIAITTQRLGIDRLELKMHGEGPIPVCLNISSPKQIREYKEAENKLKTECIEKLVDLKVNVLLCQQPLEETQKDILLAHGIFALETVDKKDIQAVASATGAKTVGTLKELSEEDLGIAEELVNSKIAFERTVAIQGCKGSTFLLKGSTPQIMDELESAIRKGMVVLKMFSEDNRVLPGCGAAETHIAQELKYYAKTFSGKEQIAIECFSEALMAIPWCLAENNGLNAVDLIPELRKYHSNGFCNYGVGEQGCSETVCLEPLGMKRSVIRRAYEVSSLMLRIDELLVSKEIPKFHR
ncbi:MAG: hypothetical protein NWE98_01580 [Candidatus Bathyarchaeota archaeon]|nr:hypothetical protein [Candidatus Bathyarchaeota archaeon]